MKKIIATAVVLLAIVISLYVNDIPGKIFQKGKKDSMENIKIGTLALNKKAEYIDIYFAGYPLEGYGKVFAQEAERNGIDWRLLPAICRIESSGGRKPCSKYPFNVFGWGDCKTKPDFNSIEEGIEKVLRTLGGNNPKSVNYRKGMTLGEILKKYNSVDRHYYNKISMEMRKVY